MESHFGQAGKFRFGSCEWKVTFVHLVWYVSHAYVHEYRHQSFIFLFFQVENEYGYYESAYGEAGKRYAMWAASMAVSQNIGVPWIMCQQFDAPDTVVWVCFFKWSSIYLHLQIVFRALQILISWTVVKWDMKSCTWLCKCGISCIPIVLSMSNIDSVLLIYYIFCDVYLIFIIWNTFYIILM